MEAVYLCLLLMFSTSFGVPTINRQDIRHVAKTLSDKGGYGITGSKSADIVNYPYTVSFTFAPHNILVGGGAILNKNWIVCSAFEIYDIKPQELTVRAGSSSVVSGGQLLNVSKIILHENFSMISYDFDVAVVKTAAPIKLNKMAKPVKLAKAAPKAGSKAQVTGFGDTSESYPRNGDLQVATVQIKTQSECQKVHPSAGDTCICADADNVGPCYDDIGDPLISKRQLVGWFLGGDYCNFFGKLDLYSNVASLRQWILEKVKQNSKKYEMEGIDDDDFDGGFGEEDE